MIDWYPANPQVSIVVNVTDRDMLLADMEQRLRQRAGFSVATLNLDHVVKIRRQPDFRDAYARHTHVTADGRPIVWLCGLAGQEVSLVPGSDLVVPAASCAVRAGVSVALVGSTTAALSRAADVLRMQCSGIEIAAQLPPPMNFDPDGPEADKILESLGASGAGMCFLALGAPKQERFAARAQEVLPTMGFLSIGAGLDFLAGTQRRAPLFARVLALEWLWRLMSNPSRLAGRYLACFAILPPMIVAASRTRLGARRER